MSKRDTILLAVLMNMGIFAILFATAVTPIFSNLQKRSSSSIVSEEIEKKQSPPTEEVTPLSSSLSEYLRIRVSKDSSLQKIAEENGVSVEELVKINRRSSHLIQEGEFLYIPLSSFLSDKKEESSSQSEEEQRVEDTSSQESLQYYLVQPGDNPWIIAKKHQIDLELFLKLNELTKEDARKLRIGQKVRIK